MKKSLFLFLCLVLIGCTNQNISEHQSGSFSFGNSSYISHYVDSEENSFEEESNNNEEFEALQLDDNTCKVKIDGKEIIYTADKIINNEEFNASSHLYLQETSDSNNFLVINGGTLILNETTIVKKGNSLSPNEDTLKYGVNASILVIGENSKVQISDVAINVFASYSSGIHCLFGGIAEIASTDVLIVSEASHAFSTYLNGMIFSESILTLIDSIKAVAFALYEGGGLISVLGNNNYIEVHGDSSYVGILKSGVMILKNIYGYSENSTLFDVTEGASLTLENSLITES